ncbi:TSUP family transporter [Oceanicoccus sp. KOV_DT_Chl]|uniref:TSUP family transporter n=1 Tax=Oceanicoccus sp. KOV_DT_Chl TaxID=1904639 RepID=UPI000C7A6C0A|nr:TSUP family transporter [Oceanicoccus sp. KOV_DT_Chl]
MELDLVTLLGLALVGLLAGTVDSIAGGGGLITLPALLATGMPPAAVLGTNKLQSCFGAFSATRYFFKQGLIDLVAMRQAIICTFVGSAIGTLTVQAIDSTLLSKMLPFLLMIFAVYFLLTPRLNESSSQQKISTSMFGFFIGSSIGFYDGFFGPGTGSFFAIAFIFLLGYGTTKATANTKLLNFTSNIASLIFFALGGHVVWTIGLTMAVGQVIGGRIGSGLVVSKGVRIVKPLLVSVSLIMSLRLLQQDYPEWFSAFTF